MPLAPTPNMLLIRPTPGADDDIWDDALNTLVALIDSHTHVTNQGAKVVSAGININAVLEFNSNRATELAGAAFDNLGAALTTGARELFVSSGNLFYRNNTGTNVRITNAGTLDQTTVGGIAGDYSAVGAELAFVDAIDTYTLKQQLGGGVRQWAKIQSADISLFEYKAHPAVGVPANSVTLKSPVALAASYTLTVPAALPGTQQILQVTAAGVISASNTVPNPVLLSSTLGVTGLITATAGLTAAVNQHVTVSGTGDLKHGDRVLSLPAAHGAVQAGTPWVLITSIAAIATSWSAAAIGAGNFVFFSILLKHGDRIKEVRAMLRDTAAGNTISMRLMQSTSVDTSAQIGATITSAGTGVNQTLALLGLTTTLASGSYYHVAIGTVAGTNTTARVYGIEITYDRP